MFKSLIWVKTLSVVMVRYLQAFSHSIVEQYVKQADDISKWCMHDYRPFPYRYLGLTRSGCSTDGRQKVEYLLKNCNKDQYQYQYSRTKPEYKLLFLIKSTSSSYRYVIYSASHIIFGGCVGGGMIESLVYSHSKVHVYHRH